MGNHEGEVSKNRWCRGLIDCTCGRTSKSVQRMHELNAQGLYIVGY